MDKISTLSLNGLDIDLFYKNGFLAYSFEKDGQAFGSKLKLPSKSVLDIASVSFLLFTNAIETHAELNNQSRAGSKAKKTKSGVISSTESK